MPAESEEDDYKVLTRDEIDTLLRACGSNARNALIIRTLADTGMRVGELINLRGRDIKFNSHTKSYELALRGKTGSGIGLVEIYNIR